MSNRLKTTYEWIVEQIDEHDDIIDTNSHDSYEDAMSERLDVAHGAVRMDVGICRDVGNNEQGVVDRVWAYVRGGVLPEYFTDGTEIDGEVAEVSIKVPKRFHAEVSAYRAAFFKAGV
jgi:hypothetical protein